MNKITNEEIFSETLICHWRSIMPMDETGIRIDIPSRNCTDMTGAIKVATAVMPHVAVIHVYCDDKLDNVYRREESKAPWQCIYHG